MRALVVLICVSSTAWAQPARIDALMKPWTGTETAGCAVAVRGSRGMQGFTAVVGEVRGIGFERL